MSKKARKNHLMGIILMMCGGLLASPALAGNRETMPPRETLTFEREMPDTVTPGGAWKPHTVCSEANACTSSWTETVGTKVGTVTISLPFDHICEAGAMISWEQWSTGDTRSKVEIGFIRSEDVPTDGTSKVFKILPLMSRGCVMGCPDREIWSGEESDERTSVTYDLREIIAAHNEIDQNSVDCEADTVILQFTASAVDDPTVAFRLDNVSIRLGGTTWGPDAPEYLYTTLDRRHQDPQYGMTWSDPRFRPSYGYGYGYHQRNRDRYHNRGRTRITITPPSPGKVHRELTDFMRNLPRPPGAPDLFGSDKKEKKEKKKKK